MTDPDHHVLPGGNGIEVPELLRRGEVAVMFGVRPESVSRWARAGRLSCIRTLGGHRRFRADEVRALLRSELPRKS